MLDYVALGILVFAVITVFYGIIAIHDIPYEIAKHRNHPQQDAIHIAGWVSLLTLHIMWPFLWIWASLYREDRGWGFSSDMNASSDDLRSQLNNIKAQLEQIESRIANTPVEPSAPDDTEE